MSPVRQLLGAGLVEDHPESRWPGRGEGDPRRDVRLDHPGDDVDPGTLRRDDEVDADGAGLLSEAGDRLLDVARGDHHQVGELIDDDSDVRESLRLASLAGSGSSVPGRTPRCSRESR